ncbi:MAG: hypothetical protein ABH950_05125 [Candidatus Altiarchaeota archaeon]
MNVPVKHRAFAEISPNGKVRLLFRTRQDYIDYVNKIFRLPNTEIDDELSWTDWMGKKESPKDRDDSIVNCLIYSADVCTRGKSDGWRFEKESIAFLKDMASRLGPERHAEIRKRVYEDIGEEQQSKKNVDSVLDEFGILKKISPLSKASGDEWGRALDQGKFAFESVKGTIFVDKKNDRGVFQGLYVTSDGRYVEFRSSKKNDLTSLNAYQLVLDDNNGGSIDADSDATFHRIRKIAEFEKCREDGEMRISYRRVAKPFRRLGIANEAFEKLESEAAAVGEKNITVLTVDENHEGLVKKRGYINEGFNEYWGRDIWRKELNPKPSEFDLSTHHTFPVFEDGKPTSMVVPINTVSGKSHTL